MEFTDLVTRTLNATFANFKIVILWCVTPCILLHVWVPKLRGNIFLHLQDQVDWAEDRVDSCGQCFMLI